MAGSLCVDHSTTCLLQSLSLTRLLSPTHCLTNANTHTCTHTHKHTYTFFTLFDKQNLLPAVLALINATSHDCSCHYDKLMGFLLDGSLSHIQNGPLLLGSSNS